MAILQPISGNQGDAEDLPDCTLAHNCEESSMLTVLNTLIPFHSIDYPLGDGY